MDKHFSVTKNKDLITFCRCAVLRRWELEQIREFDEEIETVKRLCKEAGPNEIFLNPHSNADIHSYRADYAKGVMKKQN